MLQHLVGNRRARAADNLALVPPHDDVFDRVCVEEVEERHPVVRRELAQHGNRRLDLVRLNLAEISLRKPGGFGDLLKRRAALFPQSFYALSKHLPFVTALSVFLLRGFFYNYNKNF